LFLVQENQRRDKNLLSVSRAATDKEIKRAYLIKAKELHSDRNPDDKRLMNHLNARIKHMLFYMINMDMKVSDNICLSNHNENIDKNRWCKGSNIINVFYRNRASM
jgi:hypothetical protein